MQSDKERRTFLKKAGLAGIAVPGAAFLSHVPPSQAQDARPAAHSAFYGVRAFGAVGDGKTLDTSAINRAIDAAAGAGGGTVHFPAGNYLSYSIHLKSKVTLYLDQGATIVAA